MLNGHTLLDFIDKRPAPPTFERYEKPDHSRPPPVGIPYGYILEVTTTVCGGCGTCHESSRLLCVDRAGFGHKTMALGASSPVYDRAIKRVNRTQGTPACLSCVEDITPHAVQYPVPGAAVGRSAAMATAANAKPPKAIVKPSDVEEDFL